MLAQKQPSLPIINATSGLADFGDFLSLNGIRVTANERLANHTTFRIGGPADLFCIAEDADSLLNILRLCRIHEIPAFILGGGSNILVSDRGIRGVVIKNLSKRISWEGTSPIADSGVFMPELANAAMRLNLSGCEFMQTVPGTIGGGVVQNARFRNPEHFTSYSGLAATRSKDVDMASLIERLWVLKENNEVVELTRAQCDFSYEGLKFEGKPADLSWLILRVKFNPLTKVDPQHIRDKMKQFAYWRSRRTLKAQEGELEQPIDPYTKSKPRQPSAPSAGCVFYNVINHLDHPTGRLIELCGLKGMRLGDAEISTEHANYIVNRGQAKAEDVRKLMDICKERVKQQFGIELREEIRFVGEW